MLRAALFATALILAASSPDAHAADPGASLADLALTKLNGDALAAEALKGKAVLFVNVASKCGFTKQYDGLQALYEARKEDGLVVVGVPCNQFGGQEPGSPEQIQSFCRTTYGVSFPLLEKQDVNGADRSTLYQRLVNSSAGGGDDIRWNFEKFVVDRKGHVVARFGSSVTPNDPKLAAAIDQALAAP